MQNRSNIYTIYDNVLPPSYAEATAAPASETHNPQFEQRCPHIPVCPSPSAPFSNTYSNCYLDRAPFQPAYPQYESAEQSSHQSMGVTYNRSLITGTKKDNSCSGFVRIIWILAVLASIGAMITLILRAIR